ncbi:hypothetical protein COU78_06605 [Candidatus Peregrinibacteria bacterium CG10_big_fil_rev_8_21_14_0_10_49_24]|nr:MAG: hypothetical protein COV83_00080 [Candidatus Peregrinibacteria bacterium CG11_big_fil_rev_8_21_14_0_20_49_14]PIR50519.1 MAG: hypothetical protein COU78_06605 [Candidatus Peregrinibacteria bacterium CG10_big_fil_rev_8_21_14_0_10_49_24]PJA67808.1 MAG: hypothetical protein CO157_02210 [Candidatus Peregrinibacteria bacterium CG_4_9_14_3_um_filter_49_12]
MVDRTTRAEELSEGHSEQKRYAKLAHSKLREKGITRFRDKAGREYWISEQKIQIILPDQSEVHYNVDSNSISIKSAGEQHFVAYEEFAGNFAPFVNAVRMAQSIALSENLDEEGKVLARLHEGRGGVAGAMNELMHS